MDVEGFLMREYFSDYTQLEEGRPMSPVEVPFISPMLTVARIGIYGDIFLHLVSSK